MPPFLGAPLSGPASSSSSDGTGESDESDERSDESLSEVILQAWVPSLYVFGVAGGKECRVPDVRRGMRLKVTASRDPRNLTRQRS